LAPLHSDTYLQPIRQGKTPKNYVTIDYHQQVTFWQIDASKKLAKFLRGHDVLSDSSSAVSLKPRGELKTKMTSPEQAHSMLGTFMKGKQP
jgi:hypothetical protein